MSIETNLPHPDAPVIFAANHKFPVLLFPRVCEIKKKFNERKILFVCDAAFGWALESRKLNIIKIDKRGCYKHEENVNDRIKMYLTEMFGRSINAYSNAKNGNDTVSAMATGLLEGNDIFIFPSGLSRPDAKWKSGVGRVINQIDSNKVGLGFV